MKRPLMRKTYFTKSGIHVRLIATQKEYRKGKREWRALCVRVGTGGNHGWMWARNLTEAKR